MYNDSVSLLKSLSEKYDSCKDKNNFFIYLWDKKELSPSGFRVLYNNACSVLSIGTGASKEDMILLMLILIWMIYILCLMLLMISCLKRIIYIY